MANQKPQILLTNDDGIESPGLWAAAKALSRIGYVWVAAPRDQASSTGRSMPLSSDGRIQVKQMEVDGQEWTVHAVGGTPAQTVLHAIYEILPSPPDLIVSGINYGLNTGLAVTISGTVGAAIEGAVNGIPSIAVSLQTEVSHFYSYSDEIDFPAAAHFTQLFASHLLDPEIDFGARLIKIEVPDNATEQTDWKLSRLSMDRMYHLSADHARDWDQPYRLEWAFLADKALQPGTDLHTVLVERKVAVTPLTLDMTAPVSFEDLDARLRRG